jgi:hypothetical protein
MLANPLVLLVKRGWVGSFKASLIELRRRYSLRSELRIWLETLYIRLHWIELWLRSVLIHIYSHVHPSEHVCLGRSRLELRSWLLELVRHTHRLLNHWIEGWVESRLNWLVLGVPLEIKVVQCWVLGWRLARVLVIHWVKILEVDVHISLSIAIAAISSLEILEPIILMIGCWGLSESILEIGETVNQISIGWLGLRYWFKANEVIHYCRLSCRLSRGWDRLKLLWDLFYLLGVLLLLALLLILFLLLLFLFLVLRVRIIAWFFILVVSLSSTTVWVELVHILVKFTPVFPKETSRVITHVGVSPSLVQVLILYKTWYLTAAGILTWLLKVSCESCFPVGVNDIVVNVFVELNHLGLPLIQVNWLDFGDVNLQITMFAWAPQANKGSKGRGCPSWSLTIAISTLSVLFLSKQTFKKLYLLVYIHLVSLFQIQLCRIFNEI